MDQTWSVPGWVVLTTLAVLAGLVVGLAVALRRTRSAGTAAQASARAETIALAARVDAVERVLAAGRQRPGPRTDETEYVVTMLGREAEVDDAVDPAPVSPGVPGPLFADLVLREGVVQAASLAAGLRRALAPETRHRIRAEMRREVRRARKQRRADLRRAKRDLDDRRRAPAESAA